MRDDIVSARTGGVLVVEVRGELNIAAVRRWTTVLEAAICELPGPHLLALDLGRLEFLSVRGVRGLLDVLDLCRVRGIAGCLIVSPGSGVERTVRLTGVGDRVPVFPHRLLAIATYQPTEMRWLPD